MPKALSFRPRGSAREKIDLSLLYEAVFRELDSREVKYLVIGGLAVNFHGVERPTGDLDILVSFEKDNLKKFIAAIKSIGWRPRLPVSLEAFTRPKNRERWRKQKGMKVFTIYNPKSHLEHMDVMTENYIDFEKAYRDRKYVSIREIQIPVISVPYLIRLKKIAGRERDKGDIRSLEKARELESEKKKKKSRIRV